MTTLSGTCGVPRTLGSVNWRIVAALGAAVGGVVYVVFRRNRTVVADAELWAEATDPIDRFGIDS